MSYMDQLDPCTPHTGYGRHGHLQLRGEMILVDVHNAVHDAAVAV